MTKVCKKNIKKVESAYKKSKKSRRKEVVVFKRLMVAIKKEML